MIMSNHIDKQNWYLKSNVFVPIANIYKYRQKPETINGLSGGDITSV